MMKPPESGSSLAEIPCHAELTSKFWRVADLGAAEILCAEYNDRDYAPHSHDTTCFALITAPAEARMFPEER